MFPNAVVEILYTLYTHAFQTTDQILRLYMAP